MGNSNTSAYTPSMRVVSLVPSWTETLLSCGVNVVGRTRFCVHPAGQVGAIPAVGGTKDLKREELATLKPDIVIVDKEENLPFMAEEGSRWRTHITHVEAADDVPAELDRLRDVLGNETLGSLANEWREELDHPSFPNARVETLPGILNWIRHPEEEPEVLLYLIWRGPWMAISRNTFVGSMLSQLGFGGRIPTFEAKYPKVDLGNYDPRKTLLLFSSEPYPFGHRKQELAGLEFPSALVDGEAYSWFGERSLRFLQNARRS
jgi:iron complex transport system substrate-binding protein